MRMVLILSASVQTLHAMMIWFQFTFIFSTVFEILSIQN